MRLLLFGSVLVLAPSCNDVSEIPIPTPTPQSREITVHGDPTGNIVRKLVLAVDRNDAEAVAQLAPGLDSTDVTKLASKAQCSAWAIVAVENNAMASRGCPCPPAGKFEGYYFSFSNDGKVKEMRPNAEYDVEC